MRETQKRMKDTRYKGLSLTASRDYLWRAVVRVQAGPAGLKKEELRTIL